MSREAGFYRVVYNGENTVAQYMSEGYWEITGCEYKYYDEEFEYIGEKLDLPPVPCILNEGHYWIKEREGSAWEIWEGFREPEDSFAFTRRSKFVNIEDVYEVGDFIPTPED